MKATIFIILIIWNIIVFLIYATDKSRAKKHKTRISEKALILDGVFMGAFGALLGMLACRHKTKHLKFKILIPLSLALNIGIVILLLYIL